MGLTLLYPWAPLTHCLLSSVRVQVDARGRPEQNGEVMLFEMGQHLNGKDVRGKAAKLRGHLAAVKFDNRWARKMPTESF